MKNLFRLSNNTCSLLDLFIFYYVTLFYLIFLLLNKLIISQFSKLNFYNLWTNWRGILQRRLNIKIKAYRNIFRIYRDQFGRLPVKRRNSMHQPLLSASTSSESSSRKTEWRVSKYRCLNWKIKQFKTYAGTAGHGKLIIYETETRTTIADGQEGTSRPELGWKTGSVL